jgi:hypothetical protein
MAKIFLLDHRSGIFQSFQDSNQFFSFLQRSSRNMRGKTLIVRNGEKAKSIDLQDQTAIDINKMVAQIQQQLNS